MHKKEWILIIIGCIIWLPIVILLVLNIDPYSSIVYRGYIAYFALYIFPAISGIMILWILWNWYIQKSLNLSKILILISCITFLIVGIRYLIRNIPHV